MGFDMLQNMQRSLLEVIMIDDNTRGVLHTSIVTLCDLHTLAGGLWRDVKCDIGRPALEKAITSLCDWMEASRTWNVFVIKLFEYFVSTAGESMTRHQGTRSGIGGFSSWISGLASCLTVYRKTLSEVELSIRRMCKILCKQTELERSGKLKVRLP
jgi:hypothetical protein